MASSEHVVELQAQTPLHRPHERKRRPPAFPSPQSFKFGTILRTSIESYCNHVVSYSITVSSSNFKTFQDLFFLCSCTLRSMFLLFTPSRSRWPSDAPTDFHISCAPDVEDNNGFRRPHCLQVLVQMNLCVCRSRHHSLLISSSKWKNIFGTIASKF